MSINSSRVHKLQTGLQQVNTGMFPNKGGGQTQKGGESYFSSFMKVKSRILLTFTIVIWIAVIAVNQWFSTQTA